MQDLSAFEVDLVNGGVTGWQFAGYMLGGAGAVIAICTAPAWGAVGGVLALGAITVNALESYSSE